MGCNDLLQGIFPTQRSNPSLLHCRQILYRLSHQGSPLKVFSSVQSLSHVQLIVTPWRVEPTRLLCPWNSPGKSTGVGNHSLLQGIFLNPGIKSRSPVLQANSLPSAAAAAAKSLQSCPTLCDPIDCSLPGSSIQGILQARILEWVAISFSRGSSQPRNRTWVSRIAGRRFTV